MIIIQFTDEKTEVQEDEVNCLNSHRFPKVDVEMESRSPASLQEESQEQEEVA